MSSEDEENEIVDTDTAEAEADAVASVVVRDEPAETRSLEARHKLRDQMQAEIEAFLKGGGRIEQVAPTASAQTAPLTATAGNEVS